MNIVLSLDPGITTGYCLGRMVGKEGAATMQIAYSEAKLQPADLLLLLQDLEPKIIVYEDFQYRNRSRDNLVLFSVQLIGIVEAYGTIANDCEVRKQQPAQGKGHYNDDMLRRYELYEKGVVHGRDAARHLLHFMTFGAGFRLWRDQQPAFKLVPYSTFGA